ncbi:MAG: DUF3343 domain-containing protein [Oscillospiraceae bacterium]|nr:DUF3343 domain-containing protein [Oscillospiraceae bacterium]
MYNVYLTLRSVTPGQKASVALRRVGLRHQLLRAPRAIAPGGCAYALALREGDLNRALRLLEQSNVTVQGIYLHLTDGSFERVEP